MLCRAAIWAVARGAKLVAEGEADIPLQAWDVYHAEPYCEAWRSGMQSACVPMGVIPPPPGWRVARRPTLERAQRLWMAIDCEICGAKAEEFCRPVLDGQCCTTCARINAATLRGEMFCGGGARDLHAAEADA